MAVRLSDVLVRRLHLFYATRDQAVPAASPVADWLAEALGWDATRRAEEVAAYQDLVARSRAYAKEAAAVGESRDRKSTRLNSSHSQISYAVFCLKQTHTQRGRDGDHPALRPAHRRPVGHAAILPLRQVDDGLRLHGLRDTRLLVRAAVDLAFRRPPRLVAGLGSA